MNQIISILFVVLFSVGGGYSRSAMPNNEESDLRCLKKIIDNNPSNTLDWNINLDVVDDVSNYSLEGALWDELNGKMRVVALDCSEKRLIFLDISNLEAL